MITLMSIPLQPNAGEKDAFRESLPRSSDESETFFRSYDTA